MSVPGGGGCFGRKNVKKKPFIKLKESNRSLKQKNLTEVEFSKTNFVRT